ncbi:hypothetical protein GA0115242_11651, partial [Streptomyces sp. SolWspMP-5a-2]
MGGEERLQLSAGGRFQGEGAGVGAGGEVVVDVRRHLVEVAVGHLPDGHLVGLEGGAADLEAGARSGQREGQHLVVPVVVGLGVGVGFGAGVGQQPRGHREPVAERAAGFAVDGEGEPLAVGGDDQPQVAAVRPDRAAGQLGQQPCHVLLVGAAEGDGQHDRHLGRERGQLRVLQDPADEPVLGEVAGGAVRPGDRHPVALHGGGEQVGRGSLGPRGLVGVEDLGGGAGPFGEDADGAGVEPPRGQVRPVEAGGRGGLRGGEAAVRVQGVALLGVVGGQFGQGPGPAVPHREAGERVQVDCLGPSVLPCGQAQHPPGEALGAERVGGRAEFGPREPLQAQHGGGEPVGGDADGDGGGAGRGAPGDGEAEVVARQVGGVGAEGGEGVVEVAPEGGGDRVGALSRGRAGGGGQGDLGQGQAREAVAQAGLGGAQGQPSEGGLLPLVQGGGGGVEDHGGGGRQHRSDGRCLPGGRRGVRDAGLPGRGGGRGDGCGAHLVGAESGGESGDGLGGQDA